MKIDLNELAFNFGIDLITLLKCRYNPIVFIRMAIATVLRENGYSLKMIGKILKKHHSTIMYNLAEFEQLLLQKMPICREYYDKCKRIIENQLNENYPEFAEKKVCILEDKILNSQNEIYEIKELIKQIREGYERK